MGRLPLLVGLERCRAAGTRQSVPSSLYSKICVMHVASLPSECIQEMTRAPATVDGATGEPMEAMVGVGMAVGSAGRTTTGDQPMGRGVHSLSCSKVPTWH